MYDFCGFKAKREEIKNNHFKNNGKTERIFPTQMFLNQEIRNRNESFSNVFAKKATTFLNFGFIKME